MLPKGSNSSASESLWIDLAGPESWETGFCSTGPEPDFPVLYDFALLLATGPTLASASDTDSDSPSSPKTASKGLSFSMAAGSGLGEPSCVPTVAATQSYARASRDPAALVVEPSSATARSASTSTVRDAPMSCMADSIYRVQDSTALPPGATQESIAASRAWIDSATQYSPEDDS